MTQQRSPQTVEEMLLDDRTFIQRAVDWFRVEGKSLGLSLGLHLSILLVFGLFFGKTIYKKIVGDAPAFDAANIDQSNEQISRFDIGNSPLDPSELSPDTLAMKEPPGQEAIYYNDAPKFEEMGGGSAAAKDDGSGGLGLNLKLSGMGPVLAGGGGADIGKGAGTGAGRGGAGTGFGHRGQGHREGFAGSGMTKTSERAVAGALNWLARHQNANGSWSTGHFRGRCREGTCNGEGSIDSLFGGTALGLLPFLAAGQTHLEKGIYQIQVAKAVKWLLQNQKPGGELFDGSYAMYEHGMATIALCEVFGMTGDSAVRQAAQNAVSFIQKAQNNEGGWRYMPGSEDSDTSVIGWQMMALKSGTMAGLTVPAAAMKGGYKWLMTQAHAGGRNARGGGGGGGDSASMVGQFAYRPTRGPDGPGDPVPSPCMTAVGLLIVQYMGATRNDPVLSSGVKYLMEHLPSTKERNTYYWYYATQVMHNMSGADWDNWNRRMRRVLIESQVKTGCSSGSWDPDKPAADDGYGAQGGRLMLTSLSALTLEVYYRYLPLYRVDDEGAAKGKKAAK